MTNTEDELPVEEADLAMSPVEDPSEPAIHERSEDSGRETVLPSTITRRQAALDLAWILGLLVVLPQASSVFWAPELGGEQKVALDGLAIAKWIQVGLALFVLIVLARFRRIPWRRFGLWLPRPSPLLGWGCAGLAAMYGTLLASAIALIGLSLVVAPGGRDAMMSDAQQRADVLGSLDLGDPRITIVLLIAVALHEELIFRALLVPYLHRLTGRWWPAILGSAVIFGSLHGAQGVLGIVQASLLGIVLAIVYVRSRSIAPVVLAHFAFDALQFALIGAAAPLLEEMQKAVPPG